MCPCKQKHDLAEALLYVCRRLWGQPHVAPIYAMLLYQWLLLHRDAGGAEQRLKHLKVMVSGALALWHATHDASSPSAPHVRSLRAVMSPMVTPT